MNYNARYLAEVKYVGLRDEYVRRIEDQMRESLIANDSEVQHWKELAIENLNHLIALDADLIYGNKILGIPGFSKRSQEQVSIFAII